jgi:hypothetical protein
MLEGYFLSEALNRFKDPVGRQQIGRTKT